MRSIHRLPPQVVLCNLIEILGKESIIFTVEVKYIYWSTSNMCDLAGRKSSLWGNGLI